MRNFALIETRLGSDNAKSGLAQLKIAFKGKKVHLSASSVESAPVAVYFVAESKGVDEAVFRGRIRKAVARFRDNFAVSTKISVYFGKMPDDPEEL